MAPRSLGGWCRWGAGTASHIAGLEAMQIIVVAVVLALLIVA